MRFLVRVTISNNHIIGAIYKQASTTTGEWYDLTDPYIFAKPKHDKYNFSRMVQDVNAVATTVTTALLYAGQPAELITLQ